MNIAADIAQKTSIPWFDQFHYDDAVSLARQTGKPILLDLYSESSKGCRDLQHGAYSDRAVIEKINRHVIPVRCHVDSTEPNPITSAIVGSHIFIWSQTVQLICPDGDIYHKFLGGPRHTRLDMGYTRVHHDLDGHLPAQEFIAQLELGLAKAALFEGNHAAAGDALRELLQSYPETSLAHREARYWLPLAESRGAAPRRAKKTTPTKAPLARAVERLCEALVLVPDDELMQDWNGNPGPGDWAKYSDCLREVVFGVYQALLDTANLVTDRRVSEGNPPTGAQRILGHHQVAYRELQGILVGLDGQEFDQIHLRQNFSLGRQRSIRNNLVHCVMAEWWAHAPQVRATLRGLREGRKGEENTAAETIARWGEPPNNFGDIGDLIARSEVVHAELIDEFSSITDEELDAAAKWWEDQPVSVRFRLNRFGWHLHDHAAVIETILERVGRRRSETERLAKLVYRALGQVEGALLGLPEEQREEATRGILRFVESRAAEIEQVAASFSPRNSA